MASTTFIKIAVGIGKGHHGGEFVSVCLREFGGIKPMTAVYAYAGTLDAQASELTEAELITLIQRDVCKQWDFPRPIVIDGEAERQL